MRTETYDLTDLFTKPLVSKHGIVILGPTETTGFGKTQFVLRLIFFFTPVSRSFTLDVGCVFLLLPYTCFQEFYS